MSRRGWMLFALMGVLWGIPYLMIKVAVESVSVPMVVFTRTALGALVLLPLVIRSGQLGTVRRHWRPLLAFTAVEILGPWALLSDAENRLTSSMTGLLIAAVPIVGVVLARFTGDAERLGPVRWLGLLVGLAGVGVLAAPHLSGGSAWAIGEVMLVVLGYSIAPIITMRKLQDLPSLHMAAFALAIAALVYTGPAIATWPDAMPSGRVLAALIALGLVCTALAFIVFFELIREVGTSRGMVFTYVNPAVAVAAGVVFLGEPLTGTIIASFALILGGSVLATARRTSSPAAAEPARGGSVAGEVAPDDAKSAPEPAS
ncbi:Permease of the drug/metabolite transporter (DMT) superfamily [Actinomadura meyerae]|uniref:Permease of the drug/metabolite transporter (DMT) superfamily n=1 Tax=Actinomadura meyerae TaxID=240840 RepID=A0A239KSF1_9ACTN|nr:DMT family transporter [Actinomadura meyerae]SNT20985.1 Permease of the drug/metabolite transporter (DMT) superfamily [Actinomadura meyerae]